MRRRPALALAFALVLLPAPTLTGRAVAQLPSVPSTSSRPLALRGEMGTASEAYGISGAEARRPWGTQQLFFNPTVTLFGSVDLAVNLLVSTEQGSDVGLRGLPGRQSLNELGLNPQWKWGRGNLGWFSETYTTNTLAGVRLRGAGVELHPGIFRFGAFGGRSSGPVFGGLTSGSYARNMVGGRIGLGRAERAQRSSFIELILLRAWDDPNSLPAAGDSTAPELPPDLIAANPFAVTPEENVVAAAVGGLSLLQGKLFWKGEVDAAVHTRDRRASPLAEEELGDYPGILGAILTPRVGTHGDFAYSSELELRLPTLPGATRASPRTLTASLGYRYVGAGYVSLGTPSNLNDLRKLEAKTALRMGPWSVRLDGFRQHDNVLGQKLSTTTRQRAAGLVTVQARRGWQVAVNAARLTMDNDATEDLRRVDYGHWTLGTTHAFSFGRQARVPRVSLSYTLQHAGDPNPLRVGNTLRSHAADARVAVRLAEDLQATPNVGVLHARVGEEAWSTRATYGLGTEWQSRGRAWTVGASVTSVRYSAGSDVLRGTVTARWRMSGADVITFSAQTSQFTDVNADGSGFEEYTARLRWSHRW